MTTMNISKGLNSTPTMKHVVPDNLLGKDLSRIVYNQSRQAPMRLLPGPTSIPADGFLTSKSGRVESMLKTMNKLAKSKLSLGVKILQIRGAEQLFRTTFSMKEGEQLLKASKCCLSTTSGPVAGRLFISTDKLAFCSDKPIAKLACPSGQFLTFHYKVVIPLAKIKRASQSENVKKPSQSTYRWSLPMNLTFGSSGVLTSRELSNFSNKLSHKFLSWLSTNKVCGWMKGKTICFPHS